MSTKQQAAVETTSAEQTPESQASASPELTIQDLGNLRAIIDVASQRGAFKAAEMAAVGSAFNKLDGFLNAVATQQPAAETTEA
jgi:hypothetical protein